MRRYLPAGLALLLVSCSSISVSHDFDPGVDFTTLRTYAWFDGGPKMPEDPLTAQRVVRALEAELPLVGLTAGAAATAEVLVHFQTSVRRRVDVTPTTVSVGYGWGRGYSAGITTMHTASTYDEGTLVVDLVGAKTKTLLWRGTAQAEVHPEHSPEEREARVQEAVRKLLAQFPPKR